MRLIDADELVKDFLNHYRTEFEIKNHCLTNEDTLSLIQNAPTIKTFTLADIEEQYRKGLEKGLSEWETERPQGTWIYKDYSYYCSCCNKSALEQEDYPYLSSYCPFCGAEMEVPND